MMRLSNWMWLPCWQQDSQPEFVYFRGRLVLNQLPQSLFLRITADSRYKLYVNGKFVEMGPARGNQDVWYVDAVEIASYLALGENILSVIVLHYPYENWNGNCGIFRTPTPGLFVQSEAEISWKCCSNEHIRIISENPYFAPLQIYEQTVGNPFFARWMQAGYDDNEWHVPRFYQHVQLTAALCPEKLLPRTIPFLYRKSRKFLHPLDQEWTVPAHSTFSVDLDAGELMTGYLRLHFKGGAGARITILQSECYAGEIIPNADPYKSLPEKRNRADNSLNLYGYTDTYYVAGFDGESYEPFWFRTFRYIRLSVKTGNTSLTISSFDYEETGYPLEVATKVETSDPTMTGIWDISERSLRRCMHESYEDCPFYEQLQYAMDTRSQILYTYAVSADPRLAFKAMDDFTHAVRSDGMINCSFPNFETNVIPGFGIYYIGMVYDYMMYFGDKKRIAGYLPTIDGLLHFFHNHLNEHGLVEKVGDVNGSGRYWSFIDWAAGWHETTGVPPCTNQGPLTMESLLYIMGLQYAAAIFDYMEQPDKAANYQKQAAQVQIAVNHFCIGENGFYQDGPGVEMYSQHAQVFAVLTDTVSLKMGTVLLEETLLHPEKYEQCSVAMMYYLFRAVEKCGLYHYTDRLWDIWREMLKNNLTTCAEDAIMSRSDCHAWGALALYELPSVILGVRPGKPGYDEILISPRTEILDWARGTVITPKGEVRVAWEKNESGIRLQMDGPEGVPIRKG